MTNWLGSTTWTALNFTGRLSCLALAYASLGEAAAAAGNPCSISSIIIEAAGTQFLEPPRFQLFLNGEQVAQIDVPGLESHAGTSEASLAEMKAAAAITKPFTINLTGDVTPKIIEIRYINDLFGTPDKPGDRNLFIRSVTVNGVKVPESQLQPDAKSHGITDATGTALYENGSLWVSSPFTPDCK